MMGLRFASQIGRSTLRASLLTALIVMSGCGQRGPLVLPDSTPPAAPAGAPPTDEDDTEPQDAEPQE